MDEAEKVRTASFSIKVINISPPVSNRTIYKHIKCVNIYIPAYLNTYTKPILIHTNCRFLMKAFFGRKIVIMESREPYCPCLACDREKMRQVKDYMKKAAKNFEDWI